MKVSDSMTRKFVRVSREATIDAAAQAMDDAGVRHLLVVDGGRLEGVLSDRDLLDVAGWLPEAVRRVIEAPSGTVADVLHSPVVSVSPEESLVAASLRLVEWGIGCLPVMEDAKLVGILTEVDLLEAYVRECEQGRIANDPPVSDLMTRELVTTVPGTPAEEAFQLMHEHGVRHLPILEADELVGFVSDRDFRRLAGRGQLEGTPVGELRPATLHTATGETPLSRAARLLSAHRISALPVVDGRRLVGILSSSDVLAHGIEAFRERASADRKASGTTRA